MVQYYWYPGGYPQPQQPQPNQMTPSNQMTPPATTGTGTAAGRQEESYIENILRMNKGKFGTFYFTFENNREWNAKVIKGYVEAAGRDHVIISDPSGKRYLMLMLYLDYVTFDEEINYNL